MKDSVSVVEIVGSRYLRTVHFLGDEIQYVSYAAPLVRAQSSRPGIMLGLRAACGALLVAAIATYYPF